MQGRKLYFASRYIHKAKTASTLTSQPSNRIPQSDYHLGTVSYQLLAALNMFCGANLAHLFKISVGCSVYMTTLLYQSFVGANIDPLGLIEIPQCIGSHEGRQPDSLRC